MLKRCISLTNHRSANCFSLTTSLQKEIVKKHTCFFGNIFVILLNRLYIMFQNKCALALVLHSSLVSTLFQCFKNGSYPMLKHLFWREKRSLKRLEMSSRSPREICIVKKNRYSCVDAPLLEVKANRHIDRKIITKVFKLLCSKSCLML